MTETALAKVPTETISTSIPFDRAALARAQEQFEAEVQEALATLPIEDDDTYAAADAWLTDLVNRKDAFLATRTRATEGLDKLLRNLRACWKPGADAAEKAEKFIKALMGNYQVRKRQREDEARARAAEAASSGDAQTMIDSLTEAAHVSAPVAGARATIGFKWVVKRIVPDLIPDELWIVDVKSIEEYAATVSGNDEPDPIPGVIFERVAKVGARR